MKMHPRRFLLPLLAVLAISANAKEYLLNIPLNDLEITSGNLPAGNVNLPHSWQGGRWVPEVMPYAVSSEAKEIHLLMDQDDNRRRWQSQFRPGHTRVIIRTDRLPLEGTLFLPKGEGDGMQPVGFRVKKTSSVGEMEFHNGRKEHYEQLLARGIPGAAWFRHQADFSAAVMRKLDANVTNAVNPNRRPNRPSRGSLEDTLDLFSGGRALSENLQFDRELRLSPEANATISVKNVTGITIAEMEWKELLGDKKPALDPLAKVIPADQHAIFFPSFADLLTIFDEAALQGTPLLRLAEARSESAQSKEKYRDQLCLPVTELSRLLGPKLIASVAMTGGDPFLRTGTDLTILYEAKQTEALVASLALRRLQTSQKRKDTKAVTGTVAGIDYVGLVSPDHSVKSYSAVLGKNIVVVTNSLAQLRRLAAAESGKKPNLASLDEYSFFRSRYLRSVDVEEQAFLMVTDAAIRRWCGPAWRIGASRRTRAAAALSELQARHEAGEKLQSKEFPELGKVSLIAGKVQSSKYGNLGFLTPITEMGIKKISAPEKRAYDIFRDRYQSNWSAFFDPIAARLVIDEGHLSADISIMPLIANSDYRQIISTTGTVKLDPNAGDPHEESLVHWITALDMKSRTMQQAGNMAALFAPSLGLNAFGWVGQWMSVYADESPFWEDFRKAVAKDGEDGAEEFMKDNVGRLPLALNVEATNPFKLTAFLAALRAWIEQTAPGMTTWTNHEYKKQGYVKIAPSGDILEDLEEEGVDEIALYYAPSSKLLTVTLNEALLKRSLDRRLEARKMKKEKRPLPENPKPWLGESASITVDSKLISFLDVFSRDEMTMQFRRRSWNNLPILNEWKLNLGKDDALAYHTKTWHVLLTCPGGGEYVWNEKFQTYESTVFGHPGQPKTPKDPASLLKGFKRLDFGLTFEHDGLRARGTAWKRLQNSGD
jgi:hypothetical protein